MGETRKPRTDVKVLMCAVLDILREKTDEKHPLTIKEILDILKQNYELDPDRDTVASLLGALRQNYPGPDKVMCREAEKESGSLYTYSYYLERSFTAEEVEMLLNDVMFSRMRTGEQAKTLIKKIRGLAGPNHRKELAYADFLPFPLYTANALTQENIALLQRVISGNLHNKSKETVVSFQFNGYGSDHKLHKAPGGTYQNLLPLKILEAYGSYYLMGLQDGKSTPWNLQLDLITKLTARERDKVPDAAREQVARMAASQNALSAYLTRHLYMAYERKNETVKAFYLRVEKIPYKPEASLTILHNAFGRNYQVICENDRYADIRVEGVLWGITSFVRQNMDRVRVTGPEDLKAAVEDSLRKDFEIYFQKSQKK